MPPSDDLGAAEANAATRRWTDALRVLAPLLAAQPDDVAALSLASYCHLALGRADVALAAADSASALSPGSPGDAVLRSQALRALKRYGEARAANDEAVRLAPNRVDVHVERAAVDSAARKATKAGSVAAQEAVRLAPNDPAAHVAVGNLHLLHRRRPAAEGSYREALRLDPTNRAAQSNLAQVKQLSGRNSEAIRLLVGLVRLDPTDRAYETQLRGVYTGDVLAAAMFSLVVALFGTKSATRPEPSAGVVALVLAVCILGQGGAGLWLRRVGGGCRSASCSVMSWAAAGARSCSS